VSQKGNFQIEGLLREIVATEIASFKALGSGLWGCRELNDIDNEGYCSH
jgi:hypothetical protein